MKWAIMYFFLIYIVYFKYPPCSLSYLLASIWVSMIWIAKSCWTAVYQNYAYWSKIVWFDQFTDELSTNHSELPYIKGNGRLENHIIQRSMSECWGHYHYFALLLQLLLLLVSLCFLCKILSVRWLSFYSTESIVFCK